MVRRCLTCHRYLDYNHLLSEIIEDCEKDEEMLEALRPQLERLAEALGLETETVIACEDEAYGDDQVYDSWHDLDVGGEG